MIFQFLGRCIPAIGGGEETGDTVIIENEDKKDLTVKGVQDATRRIMAFVRYIARQFHIRYHSFNFFTTF